MHWGFLKPCSCSKAVSSLSLSRGKEGEETNLYIKFRVFTILLYLRAYEKQSFIPFFNYCFIPICYCANAGEESELQDFLNR